ncbi:hypothetical protein K501DRAFT_276911 [Backusella circina FSU 941]|nr:hypothetical protein K501DRAFT_276911 [Backusella circina FSU 941]
MLLKRNRTSQSKESACQLCCIYDFLATRTFQSGLSHSVKREQWLREQPYEVKGDQVAGKTNSPSIGRKKYEEKQPLFGDMYFYFSGDFPSKYNKKDLSQLCQSAGGTLLKRKPTTADTDLDRTIIIHPESTKAAHRWLEDFKVKDPSWVIDSVIREKEEKE